MLAADVTRDRGHRGLQDVDSAVIPRRFGGSSVSIWAAALALGRIVKESFGQRIGARLRRKLHGKRALISTT